jgi:hypothetical protein
MIVWLFNAAIFQAPAARQGMRITNHHAKQMQKKVDQSHAVGLLQRNQAVRIYRKTQIAGQGEIHEWVQNSHSGAQRLEN